MKDQEIIDMVFNEGSKEMIESIKTKIMSMIVKYGKNANIVAEEIAKKINKEELKSKVDVYKTGERKGKPKQRELEFAIHNEVVKQLKAMGLYGISSTSNIVSIVAKSF